MPAKRSKRTAAKTTDDSEPAPKCLKKEKLKAAAKSKHEAEKGDAAPLKEKPAPKSSKKGKNEKAVKSKYFPEASKGDDKEKPVANAEPLDVGAGRMSFSFYDVPCDQLARDLLGKQLVTQRDGVRIAGTIVETEAYMGVIDKAAHSYNGKRTDKTEAMFMQPGTSYVYNIYGMYCCINISAQGEGAAVLIRAIEPTENIETMNKLRTKGKGGDALLKKGGKGLSNGPSKLAQAFNITKPSLNKHDMCTSKEIWLEKGVTVDPSDIVTSTRINIDYAEDWTSKPLRFYIKGNNFVSVLDKVAEAKMNS